MSGNTEAVPALVHMHVRACHLGAPYAPLRRLRMPASLTSIRWLHQVTNLSSGDC